MPVQTGKATKALHPPAFVSALAPNRQAARDLGQPAELTSTDNGPFSAAGYPQPSASLPHWINDLRHADHPGGPPLDGLPASQAGDVEDMSWELRTETVGNAGDQNEPTMADMQSSHARQLAHYKNLLIRAQSASSTALHELHTQLHQAQAAYDALSAEHAECGTRDRQARLDHQLAEAIGSQELVHKISVLAKQDKVRLLGIVAEVCDPSDVSAQIALLEKYKRSRFDILGRLDTSLAVSILCLLEVTDVLNLRLVSPMCRNLRHTWLWSRLKQQVSRHCRDLTLRPSMWRLLCRTIDSDCDHGQGEAASDTSSRADWEAVYRGLNMRERNWREGKVQHVSVLPGHTDYVTSLKLRGDTLISGSYDGTVRVWQLPRYHPIHEALPPPTIIHSKSVSCLDYWPDKRVIATGYHDLGRVQIWQYRDKAWEAVMLLSGHLHGIRAIAMNERYLVSAGADKAIVIWDYETGEKITRFGQQTNICAGIHLVHDKVMSVTVDGVIRAFDVAKRQMVAQYSLSDLCKGREGSEPLRTASVLWVQGRGPRLTCGTKSAIVRLQWEEVLEQPVPSPAESPKAKGPPTPTRQRHVSMSHTSPATATSNVSPLRRQVGPVKTPTKRVSSLNLSSAGISTSPTVSPRGPLSTSTPRRSVTALTSASSATLVSPSPHRTAPKSMIPSALPKRQAALQAASTSRTGQADEPRLVPRLATAPEILAIVRTPPVERGVIDEKTGRIVLATVHLSS